MIMSKASLFKQYEKTFRLSLSFSKDFGAFLIGKTELMQCLTHEN